MSGKCPKCSQTVVADKGKPVGPHTSPKEPAGCSGAGKPAK